MANYDLGYDKGYVAGKQDLRDEVRALVRELDKGRLDLPGFVWEIRDLVFDKS